MRIALLNRSLLLEGTSEVSLIERGEETHSMNDFISLNQYNSN